jgi:hypothetical protein
MRFADAELRELARVAGAEAASRGDRSGKSTTKKRTPSVIRLPAILVMTLMTAPALAADPPVKGPGDTPASTSPPGQPENSETSDRSPEKQTPTAGSEKDRSAPLSPDTKTPRAPDEMKH